MSNFMNGNFKTQLAKMTKRNKEVDKEEDKENSKSIFYNINRRIDKYKKDPTPQGHVNDASSQQKMNDHDFDFNFESSKIKFEHYKNTSYFHDNIKDCFQKHFSLEQKRDIINVFDIYKNSKYVAELYGVGCNTIIGITKKVSRKRVTEALKLKPRKTIHYSYTEMDIILKLMGPNLENLEKVAHDHGVAPRTITRDWIYDVPKHKNSIGIEYPIQTITQSHVDMIDTKSIMFGSEFVTLPNNINFYSLLLLHIKNNINNIENFFDYLGYYILHLIDIGYKFYTYIKYLNMETSFYCQLSPRNVLDNIYLSVKKEFYQTKIVMDCYQDKRNKKRMVVNQILV